MTTATTTPSIRDWIIDCAVRWQRRHKLVVPRAHELAEEVSAVIGPRDANLKSLLPSLEPRLLPMTEPPIEQTLTIPMPTPPTFETDDTRLSPAPEASALVVEAVAVVDAMAAVAPPPPETPEDTPPIDMSGMADWQVLILSGPAGSGKSSIAQQFCELLPRSVHIKVEPLRDRAFSVLVAQPFGENGRESGTMPEVWSGTTDEARQQATELAGAYLHTGHRVIIDDVIEAPSELGHYQDGLADLHVRTVTLMPGLEEMERRDKVRPIDQQVGPRIKEFHATMVRLLSAHSVVLDISQETAPETVQRILALLQPQA